ncbi:uncharacterized protein BDV14DRAFT_188660 [Aspergillus stella-maris]|uniref:uncharacterized protein n=1 Tax=Aspergillus stella-maris TaxID=1810926 RepID=UPI003CCCD964
MPNSSPRATVVFTKINFAMSILAIPAALAEMGSVGGSLSIIGFTALNTNTCVLLGQFRNRHLECHMLADMMGVLWGRTGRELVGVQIVIAQILIFASGIVTTATAFNALSKHGACAVVVALLPAAAPATGDYDLGWTPITYPTFVSGMLNAASVFVATSGSSMFLPVVSEMRRPQDYTKACIISGFLVGAIYLTFSLVIYRWCGIWLSVPAFGSAGPLFKKISYGIACLDLSSDLVFPPLLWMYDYKVLRSGPVGRRVHYGLHVVIVAVGLLMIVAGTYAAAVSIRDAFASGDIPGVFDCRDNSGSSA